MQTQIPAETTFGLKHFENNLKKFKTNLPELLKPELCNRRVSCQQSDFKFDQSVVYCHDWKHNKVIAGDSNSNSE